MVLQRVLQPGIIQSPQARFRPAISEVNVPDRTTIIGSSVKHLHSVLYLGNDSLVYTTNASDYCEMSKTSCLSQHQYSTSIDCTRISNCNYNSNALNDSHDVCISSPEKDELKSSVEIGNGHAIERKRNSSVSTTNRKTAKRKVFNAIGRFRIVCEFGNCHEMLENSDAVRRHLENYHRKGIKKTFTCYLCKHISKTMGALREHFNSVHSHNKLFHCTFQSCSKLYTLDRNRQIHIDAVHINKIAYRCPKCPYKTFYKYVFTKHMKICTAEQRTNIQQKSVRARCSEIHYKPIEVKT